jgi:hypothetical protein
VFSVFAAFALLAITVFGVLIAWPVAVLGACFGASVRVEAVEAGIVVAVGVAVGAGLGRAWAVGSVVVAVHTRSRAASVEGGVTA